MEMRRDPYLVVARTMYPVLALKRATYEDSRKWRVLSQREIDIFEDPEREPAPDVRIRINRVVPAGRGRIIHHYYWRLRGVATQNNG